MFSLAQYRQLAAGNGGPGRYAAASYRRTVRPAQKTDSTETIAPAIHALEKKSLKTAKPAMVQITCVNKSQKLKNHCRLLW